MRCVLVYLCVRLILYPLIQKRYGKPNKCLRDADQKSLNVWFPWASGLGGFPPSHLALLSSLWLSGNLSVFTWELMSLPLAAAGPWHPETTTLTSRHYYTDILTLPAAGPWHPDNATLPSRHCFQGCFVWWMSGQCQLQEHSLWSLLNQPCTRYLQWNCDGGYAPYFSYQ